MTTQPEALSEQEAAHIYRLRDEIMQQENEMYLLRQQIERLSLDGIHSCHAECQRPLCKLTRQRDALLEALHAMLSHTAMLDPSQGFDGFDHSAVNQARAAIKAVEEQK